MDEKKNNNTQLQNCFEHSASRCYPAGICFIPSPAYVRNKGCIVNVKNVNDHLCFIYSILACMKYHTLNRGNRTLAATYKNCLKTFNYDGMSMPMKIANISQFEQCNPQVSINVIKYIPPINFKRIKINEDSIKHPYFKIVYRSIQHSPLERQSIYLLLVENNTDHCRYMAITNLEKMLILANGKYYYRNICFSCLRIFRSLDTLKKHEKLCAIFK